jgi:hypothetical protein
MTGAAAHTARDMGLVTEINISRLFVDTLPGNGFLPIPIIAQVLNGWDIEANVFMTSHTQLLAWDTGDSRFCDAGMTVLALNPVGSMSFMTERDRLIIGGLGLRPDKQYTDYNKDKQ